MKIFRAALMLVALGALASTAVAHPYGYGYSYGPGCACDCPPVATYCGSPVVGYEPGYWYGGGPYSYGYRPGYVSPGRVYYPYQPVRNTLRWLAP